jgi:hypothetical protein
MLAPCSGMPVSLKQKRAYAATPARISSLDGTTKQNRRCDLVAPGLHDHSGPCARRRRESSDGLASEGRGFEPSVSGAKEPGLCRGREFAGVVERGSLEKRYPSLPQTEGANPSPSAT